jgi:hypothetical protein
MTTIDQIKQQLRDIIELSDKATPGEWVARTGASYGSEVEHFVMRPEDDVAICSECRDPIADKHSAENAEFIAASRNLTPKMARALLGVIEWLELYAIPTEDAQAQLETIRREWEVQA